MTSLSIISKSEKTERGRKLKAVYMVCSIINGQWFPGYDLNALPTTQTGVKKVSERNHLPPSPLPTYTHDTLLTPEPRMNFNHRRVKQRSANSDTITRLAAVSGAQLVAERAAAESPVRPSFC